MHNQALTTHCDKCNVGGMLERAPLPQMEVVSRGCLKEVMSNSLALDEKQDLSRFRARMGIEGQGKVFHENEREHREHL